LYGLSWISLWLYLNVSCVMVNNLIFMFHWFLFFRFGLRMYLFKFLLRLRVLYLCFFIMSLNVMRSIICVYRIDMLDFRRRSFLLWLWMILFWMLFLMLFWMLFLIYFNILLRFCLWLFLWMFFWLLFWVFFWLGLYFLLLCLLLKLFFWCLFCLLYSWCWFFSINFIILWFLWI
jgi:hypothetical protein